MLTDLVTPESLEVQISVAQQAFETLAEMAVYPLLSPVEWEGV